MANIGIFGGTSDDWYPKKETIVPKVYHKYLNDQDKKITYPQIFSDTVVDAETGEERERTLQEIIDAVSNGSTVRLSKDYEEDIVIKSGKVIKLDLNGHKLVNVKSDTIFVELGAALTLTGKNGLVDNLTKGMAPLFNNGVTVVDGATITKSGTDYYAICNHGIMVLTNDPYVYLPEKVISSIIDNGYYDYSKNTNPRMGYVEGVNMPNPTLTIDSGKYFGGCNSIKNDDGGICTIEGGTFVAEQCGVFNVNKMTIKECTIVPMADANGQGTIYGSYKYAVYSRKYNDTINVGRIDITGGDFSGLIYELHDDYDAVINITGGTFDRESPILDETKQHWEKNANGKYVVVSGPKPASDDDEKTDAEEPTTDTSASDTTAADTEPAKDEATAE